MTSITHFHRTRCLDPGVYYQNDKVVDGFFDLYMQFLRHRVLLEFDCTGDEDEERERTLHLFEHQVVKELENECRGFWSYKETGEPTTDTFAVFIMFELEEDLEHFLAHGGLYFRMAV